MLQSEAVLENNLIPYLAHGSCASTSVLADKSPSVTLEPG